ncbi:MAG: DUF3576 domain-containing protein [Alphaproteobacteria bacterium]|nr:MAG: DUF3576 domain-containing protein [Alphaproteobacteria bacterium]
MTAALAGCGAFGGGNKGGADMPPGADRTPEQTAAETSPAKSEGGFRIFGRSKPEAKSGIGVNPFLWRATLDTLSFMPLESVDSQGGVIITDWYSNPDQANERFKMNVYILDTRLRADGVKVSVFRQEKTKDDWMDVPVNPETAIQLENQILRRARELKLDSE